MNGVSAKREQPTPKRWGIILAVGVLALLGGYLAPHFLTVSLPTPPSAGTEKSEQNPLAYQPQTWPKAPDAKGMLLRLGAGTVFVLGLCVVSLVVGRKYLHRPAGTTAKGTGHLHIVETLSLGGRSRLHLVRVGNRQVLVGMDGGGLVSISPLPDVFQEALEEELQ